MRVWSVTDRGLVRSENQDACAVLTPDGYTVDETGAWCVRGAVQTIGKK